MTPETPFLAANVAVVGLGYVGCVTAACLAHLGHKATGIDKDYHKVEDVAAGHAPFYERGLEELVQEGRVSGRLIATTSMSEGLSNADAELICVGTPSAPNGNMSVEQLHRVCAEIAPLLPSRSKRLVVAVRSTAFPGTCENVVAEALGRNPMVSVVSNPEFLREGSAVKDFMEPSLVIVGGSDPQGVAFIADLSRIAGGALSGQPAEMIKYACNVFHCGRPALELRTLDPG